MDVVRLTYVSFNRTFKKATLLRINNFISPGLSTVGQLFWRTYQFCAFSFGRIKSIKTTTKSKMAFGPTNLNCVVKLVLIFGMVHMSLCDCPVEKQENGFYVPKLMMGEKRELRIPSVKTTPPIDLNDISLTARPIPLVDALTCEEFLRTPIITDLLSSQKVNLSDDSRSVITNTNGGGILQFGALKIVKSYQAYHALQVIGTMTPGGSEARKPVFAYWLPLGGYVDVPVIPEEDDPKYVFTPGFSGGSLVADMHNISTLRIHHVAGGKENNEHENDGDEEHGFSAAFGMVGRLLHSDYGFHVNVDTCKYVENGKAFAFIKFDSGIQHWVITYQGIIHIPVINEISFAQRNNWKVKTKFSASTKVVMVDSKILGTHTGHKGKIVENRCYFGKV